MLKHLSYIYKMEMDIKAMKENPELFRLFLRNVIQELASCLNETGDVNGEFRFIKLYIQDNFKIATQHIIDLMWDEFKITDKILSLNKLEQEAPLDYVAWRPTGEVPVTNLRGYSLTNLKEKLLKKIENTEKKKDLLSKSLSTMIEDMEKCIEKVDKNEKVLLDNYKEYEEIINK